MISSYRPVLIRLIKTGLLVDIGLFVGAFIINRITEWRSLQDYGTILHLLAGLGIVVGMISVSGSWQGRERFGDEYARLGGGEEMHDLAKHDQADLQSAFGFFLQMLVAAILPVLVGWWLRSL
jgi:hypothetical protein